MSDPVGWAVVELMGHRRLAGWVSEQQIAGATLLRIDIPGSETLDESGPWSATQFYAAAAIYSITPTTADVAIRARAIGHPNPVTRWELPPADEDDPADEDHEGYSPPRAENLP